MKRYDSEIRSLYARFSRYMYLSWVFRICIRNECQLIIGNTRKIAVEILDGDIATRTIILLGFYVVYIFIVGPVSVL